MTSLMEMGGLCLQMAMSMKVNSSVARSLVLGSIVLTTATSLKALGRMINALKAFMCLKTVMFMMVSR